jgi:D-alanyl-lipoteichoic acid acyltransferase DltB (MBOAT superfamily)
LLFNSLAFALFLPAVFIGYWVLARRLTAQNLFVLGASYLFYGWWDWRFLSLIFISSLVDYVTGRLLQRTIAPVARKALLCVSLAANLGILGFFKYFNFFAESFAAMLLWFGVGAHPATLNVILPVGISFYTFQTLSYTIDVYRKRIQPTTDPLAFFAYVSFFPQLVAGPIERAEQLLPQFGRHRIFSWDLAKDGLRQMLWGFFKKVVIADNLGRDVDLIFSQYTQLHGIELALGTLYFAFQIYCDFSGYSDIAIGCARLFGFELSRNFAFPYFSRDIPEFWRRWHISLSTWFRDYLYVPLGGSRTTRALWIRNVLLTFTISGLWHGANWNFIVWGLLHGLCYLPRLWRSKKQPQSTIVAAGRILPSPQEFCRMAATFTVVLVAWIFFRADSLGEALDFIYHMLTRDWLVNPDYERGLPYIGILVVIEWIQRTKQHGLEMAHLPTGIRWAIYYAVIAGIFWYGHTGHIPFIYFQF